MSGLRGAVRRLSVQLITNEGHFKSAVAKPSLTVVYFTAEWCGPCKRIAPVFAELARENPAVAFVKVDVDEHPDIAGDAGVMAMPTFQFMKSNVVLQTIVGADDKKLAECVRDYA
ncbi:hypothetical protein AB1Y20_016891 [Prymnesium parvum]|uniref:Thioredoxin domain-containing protein n=1 Tax=Prymnesium parvum TaxID=97485 RepID=A0AB34IB43_PRYPA